MDVKNSVVSIARTILCGLYIVVILASGTAIAEQLPSEYMHATRYDMGGRVTGTIAPAVNSHFPAIRKTYNSRGMLKSEERGYLTAWQSDTIEPQHWGSAFIVNKSKHYTYDELGRVVSHSVRADSNGEMFTLTQMSYDHLGRLECEAIRMRASEFDVLLQSYSACDRGADGNFGPDRISKFTYDRLNRVLTEIRALGVEGLEQVYVAYTYDDNGFRTSVTDANNNKSEMEPDEYDRLYRWYFPVKNKGSLESSSEDYEEYQYDSNGNRIFFRNRDEKEIRYEYDNLNRVVKKDFSDTTVSDIYYDYNHKGLQLYARFGSDQGAGVENRYNGFGELRYELQHINGEIYTLENKYDENGNLRYFIYPDESELEYIYDAQDRLTDLNVAEETLMQQFYDDFSRPDTRIVGVSGNTVSISLGYDDISRLASYKLDFGGSEQDIEITYPIYNPANQLIRHSKDNGDYAYSGSGGEAGNYTADGLNQYTVINGKSLDYDDNGNLVSNGNWGYTYDIENRLVSAEEAQESGVYAELKYDPLGRLLEYRVNGSSTFFLYSGDKVVAELDGSGNITKRYIYGGDPGAPLAQYTGSSTSSSALKFLHVNHQGSVIAVTGADSHVEYINTYDAYGVPGDGNMGRFAYTGQMILAELGLFHYRARVYDPYIGRFLQTDPVGYDDQMNLYAYVHNDPMNSSDPSGMYTCTENNGVKTCEGTQDEVDQMKDEMKGYQVVDATSGFGDVGSQTQLAGDPSPNAALKSAIGRGDVRQIKNLMEALDPDMAKWAQQAIQRLQTPARDLIKAKFKRSNSYRSELEDKTFEWLLKNQKGPQKREIQQMLKLIKQENRLDQKIG